MHLFGYNAHEFYFIFLLLSNMCFLSKYSNLFQLEICCNIYKKNRLNTVRTVQEIKKIYKYSIFFITTLVLDCTSNFLKD